MRTAYLCRHHLPALPPLCSRLQCSCLQPMPSPASTRMTSTSTRSSLLILTAMLHCQRGGGKCWAGAPTASQQLPPSHSQRASKSYSTSACFFWHQKTWALLTALPHPQMYRWPHCPFCCLAVYSTGTQMNSRKQWMNHRLAYMAACSNAFPPETVKILNWGRDTLGWISS